MGYQISLDNIWKSVFGNDNILGKIRVPSANPIKLIFLKVGDYWQSGCRNGNLRATLKSTAFDK